MAVLPGATASGRQMYGGTLGTSTANLYTAPSATNNVTSPSATAYVKEIILCNTTATAAKASIAISGVGNIISSITVNGNDTKVISGLNTMLSAGQVLSGVSDTASAIQAFISGVEVQ